MLLRYKVDVNVRGRSYDFLLLRAIKRGQIETAKLLITAFLNAALDGGYRTKSFEACLSLSKWYKMLITI